MDTRPYRLNWPASTMIFDVSPQKVFDIASDKLQGLCFPCDLYKKKMSCLLLVMVGIVTCTVPGVGARIPKGCMFFHIPVDSGDIEQCLRSKGFSGNRPSIWAMQVGYMRFLIKSSTLPCNLYEC